MARVLLIIPTASYRAPEFLDAARRLSVEVVTGSERPQALAELMGDRFIELPLSDPLAAADAIVALAGRVDLDAVLAVDDQGLLAAAYAGERLGLVHNRPDAVAATRDKAVMRRRLGAAAVPQPRYEEVPFDAAPRGNRVVAAARRVGYPVVIKPVSLSGSRGVIRADDDEQAVRAAERIEALLDAIGEEATLLVEEFIPGVEVALEGLLSKGDLEVLALFDKPDPLDGPYFEETIYLTPSTLARQLQDEIARVVGDAARAIGLAEGPVHAEVRIRPDRSLAGESPTDRPVTGQSVTGQSVTGQSVTGQSVTGQSVTGQSVTGQSVTGQSVTGQSVTGQSVTGQSVTGQSVTGQSVTGEPVTGEPVVVIELAARTIGGRCATALRFSTGATLEEIVLAHALGREAVSTAASGASGVMMLPIPSTGRLVGVEGRGAALGVKGITDLDISVAPGRRVTALPEGDRYLGFIFAEGATPADVETALRAAHRELLIEIEIEP